MRSSRACTLLSFLTCSALLAPVACSGDTFNAVPPGTGGAAAQAGSGGASAGTTGEAGSNGSGAAGAAGAAGNGESGAAGSGQSGTAGAAGESGAAGNAGTTGDAGNAGNGGDAGGAGVGGDAGSGGHAGAGIGGDAGGSAEAGAGGGAGSSGAAGQGGGGAAGSTTTPPCPILYVDIGVAPSSDNDGCSEKKPLRTLHDALAKAKMSSGSTDAVGEIRLCAGTYAEAQPVIVDSPITLRGGFQCDASPWLEPSASDPTNPLRAVIEGNSTPVLRIENPTITSSTLIANLEVKLAPDGQAGEARAALVVRAGATPTMRFLSVHGPDAEARDGTGSIGLRYFGGGGGLLEASIVRGGSGKITTVGTPSSDTAASMGLVVDADAGPVDVRSSILSAGAAETTGSHPAKIAVQTRGPSLTLTDCTIGGTAIGVANEDAKATEAAIGAPTAIGIDARGTGLSSKLTVSGCTVTPGGVVSNTLASGQAVAMTLDSLTANLRSVNVYGGDATGLAASVNGNPAATATIGIRVTNAKATLDTVLIHGGGLLTPPPFSTGIEATKSTTITADFLTLSAGAGLSRAYGFSFLSPEHKLTLRSSVVLAESAVGNTTDFYAKTAACGASDGYRFTLEQTTFVHPRALVDATGGDLLVGGEGGCKTYRHVGELVNNVGPVVSVVDASQVVDADTADVTFTGMVPHASCVTNGACAAAVFQTYTSDKRLTHLQQKDGPAPMSDTLGHLVDGALFIENPSDPVRDLAGKTRSGTKTARGAFLP